jgi:hypothetical protein
MGSRQRRSARSKVELCSRSKPSKKEGTTVNKYALAAALALTIGGAAQAAAIDLVPADATTSTPGQPSRITVVPNVAVAPSTGLLIAPIRMSELPEPEVFAMMLVGLVLIGYRASRDSSEKFK